MLSGVRDGRPDGQIRCGDLAECREAQEVLSLNFPGLRGSHPCDGDSALSGINTQFIGSEITSRERRGSCPPKIPDIASSLRPPITSASSGVEASLPRA